LEKHPAADVMVERDSELVDINFANYVRDEAYNDVEYFVVSEEKIEEGQYEDFD
jgi:hypothetical protein